MFRAKPARCRHPRRHGSALTQEGTRPARGGDCGRTATPPREVSDKRGPLLTGRVAVITGGGGGIGAATASLLAAHGARVVIAEIDETLAESTVSAITAEGGHAAAAGIARR